MLLACTGAIISGIFLNTANGAVTRLIGIHAAALAEIISNQAQHALSIGDWETFESMTKDLASLDGIAFVVVTAEGRSFRWNGPGIGLEDGPDASTAAQCVTGHHLIFVKGERGEQSPIGEVVVGLSRAGAKDAFLGPSVYAVLAAALCLAGMLWLQSRQMRRLLAPLRNLAEFTSSIGEGALDRRAEIAGADEISSLATSFNRMLDRLAVSLVSRDVAEEANRAKGRFLANASHELRTPLNAIIGYSELLSDECADRGLGHILPDLSRIQNAGRMLLALVNDLLDLSKAEAGRMHFRLEPVCVGDVFEEVADTVEPLARKNGNRLTIECPSKDVVVFADRGRFRQSLLNLADNACKFTENGIVRFSANQSSGDRAMWCDVSVSDTGIGIDREGISQLFEAFAQLDSSNTRKYGGTGLGLAVSRKFCRLMGGDITVESEAGKGSTFTISLPIGPQAHESPIPVEARVEGLVQTSRNGELP